MGGTRAGSHKKPSADQSDQPTQTGALVDELLRKLAGTLGIYLKDHPLAEVPWTAVLRAAGESLRDLSTHESEALAGYNDRFGEDPAWELARQFHLLRSLYPGTVEAPPVRPSAPLLTLK